MKLTDDMKFAIRHNPGLICSCTNCDWHYPPEFENMDSEKVWCVAWGNHVDVGYLCKRWDLESDISLIQSPPWCAKRPKRRMI